MTQALSYQLVSVASMDVYRWQHSSEHPQSHLPSTKRNRNRGVILSRQGWQRLMQAKALCDEFGYRCTYEQLSERACLDERTISRLLSCEIKVDKRSLRTFFRAFNLSLEADDYILPNGNKTVPITLEAPAHTAQTTQTIEVERLIEDLSQLKQRMREYDRLFHLLDLNDISLGVIS